MVSDMKKLVLATARAISEMLTVVAKVHVVALRDCLSVVLRLLADPHVCGIGHRNVVATAPLPVKVLALVRNLGMLERACTAVLRD